MVQLITFCLIWIYLNQSELALVPSPYLIDGPLLSCSLHWVCPFTFSFWLWLNGLPECCRTCLDYRDSQTTWGSRWGIFRIFTEFIVDYEFVNRIYNTVNCPYHSLLRVYNNIWWINLIICGHLVTWSKTMFIVASTFVDHMC